MLKFICRLLISLLVIFSMSSKADDSVPTAKKQIFQYVSSRITTSLEQRFSSFKNLSIKLRFPSSVNRLSPCLQPLATDKDAESYLGTHSWWIECYDQQPWRIKVSSTTSVDVKVVSASKYLKKDHRLTTQDLTLHFTTLRNYSPVYQTLEPLIGLRLRRALKKNDVISPRHVHLNHVVEQGQVVTIFYQTPSFTIETEGVALEAGQVGDIITVQNIRSGQELSVQVEGVGRVRRY